jgi:hypothetical protein
MLFIYLLSAGVIVYYIVYTVRFSIGFRKSILFSGWIRNFHLLMIWLIPFVWIFILKSVMKSTPGSANFENKENPESSTESGLGIWMDPSTGSNNS